MKQIDEDLQFIQIFNETLTEHHRSAFNSPLRAGLTPGNAASGSLRRCNVSQPVVAQLIQLRPRSINIYFPASRHCFSSTPVVVERSLCPCRESDRNSEPAKGTLPRETACSVPFDKHKAQTTGTVLRCGGQLSCNPG